MLEEGLVTQEKLKDFMHKKVPETLYDLFMWKKETLSLIKPTLSSQDRQ